MGTGRRKGWRSGMTAVVVLAAGVVAMGSGCRRAATPVVEEDVAQVGQVASFDGVPMAYERLGAGEVAVVLIHGWSCHRGYWENQLAALAGEYTVVAVDLPGHGSSGFQRDAWSVAALGRDVATLVAALQLEQVILVGHSMGGPVSLEAARLMPGKVLGVVGVDTLHSAEWSFNQEEWEQIMTAFDQDFVGTCEQFVRGLYRPDVDATLLAWTTQDMCDARPEVATALLTSFIDLNPGEMLAAAGVPVRCINADIYPTTLEVNRKYAPDFDVVVMAETGHFPQLERPAEFTQVLLETLAGLRSPQPVS